MGFVTPPYSWYETDDAICIHIQARGVPRRTFEIFAASSFVKVNAPPFLFSCDLEGEIDETSCVATIDHEGVEIHCSKARRGIRWHRLACERTKENKMAVALRRRLSIQAARERVNAGQSNTTQGSSDARKQWQIDRKRASTIENRMTVELDVARGRLRAWQSAAEPNRSLKHNTPGEDSEYNLERYFDEELEINQSSCLLHISTPLPRSPINVSVEFTKLETEMPARETREIEIRRWKLDSRARPVPQHSITDHDSIFLKEKGDTFFKGGNYQSATNAYTLAIIAEKQVKHDTGKLICLYANRAACHMKVHRCHAAIVDCTAALHFLKTDKFDMQMYRSRRLRLLRRRANAFVRIRQLQLAENDARCAHDLHQEEVTNFRDLEEKHDLEEIHMCSSPQDISGLINFGDHRYSVGNISGAARVYGLVMRLYGRRCNEIKAASLTNRAICHLRLRDYCSAHRDCQCALNILFNHGTSVEPCKNIPFGDFSLVVKHTFGVDDMTTAFGKGNALQKNGSLELLAKLLHCKGAAAAYMRKYDVAAANLISAASISGPKSSDALGSDANILRELCTTNPANCQK